MARLSSHVLDIARGLPAAGVVVELHFGGTRIARAITNADGRTTQPLLAGDTIPPGSYDLIFYAGDYFRAAGIELTEPAFLDNIVIRFGIADPQGTYHVPLLLSPYGYSTYRGS